MLSLRIMIIDNIVDHNMLEILIGLEKICHLLIYLVECGESSRFSGVRILNFLGQGWRRN